MPPLLPIVLLFFAFVWPTVWRYSTYDGERVRVQRLTNEVQFARPGSSGGGWQVFGKTNQPGVHPPPPGRPDPGAADLVPVKISDVQLLAGLPSGLVRARATNTGNKPVAGDVIFHLYVDRRGKEENPDRYLRGSLFLPPGGTAPIALRTNLTLAPGDRVEITVTPAPVTGTLHR